MSYQEYTYSPNYHAVYPAVYGEQEPLLARYPPPPPPPGYVAVAIDPHAADQPKYERVTVAFSAKSVRAGFIRKVFALVALQLAVVAAFVAVFTFNYSAKKFIQTTGSWLYYVSYGVFIFTYIAIMCCEGVRRKHPLNLIFTAMLTLSISYMTAMIAAFYDTQVVLITFGVCAICCTGIILFASQTKYDFTLCVGVMFVVSFLLLIFGIIAIFFAIFQSPAAQYLLLVYSGLLALFFMAYLVIDIQMIIGGKRLELSPEDYILAAIQVFMDIVLIFWMLLSVIGGISR